MVTSEVRYARVGDAHVAYRVVTGASSGAHDVVLVMSGTMPMEALLEDSVALRFVHGLADCGRLVMFDRRGIGMSDPPAGSDRATFDRWCDDLDAVVAAAQVSRPVLVGTLLGASVTFLYCDRHPDEVTSLVLLEPAPPSLIDRGRIRAQVEGEVDWVTLLCPSRGDEPGFREWFDRAGQTAGPGMAERAYPEGTPDEIEDFERAASHVGLPALVLRRPSNRLSPPRESDPIMALVPTAVRVDLPGEDLVIYGARSTRW